MRIFWPRCEARGMVDGNANPSPRSGWQCSTDRPGITMQHGAGFAVPAHALAMLFGGLSPVAFDKHPTTTAVYPAMRYPNGMRAGRAIPAAGHPDIAGTVPAMVTGDPDELMTGTDGTGFHDRSGRSYADHDLRKRSGREQRDSQKQRRKKFLHGLRFLLQNPPEPLRSFAGPGLWFLERSKGRLSCATGARMLWIVLSLLRYRQARRSPELPPVQALR